MLAAVVRLLELTHIRVGNEEYARSNHSFGLTTFHDQHARITGSTVRFSFRGKSGKWHTVELHDRRLARIISKCQDLPGQELFQYVDDDGATRRRSVPRTSTTICARSAVRISRPRIFALGRERSWPRELSAKEAAESLTEAKRNVVDAVRQVAEQLGNTVAVCRKCYIHPAVLDGYLSGGLSALRLTLSSEIKVTVKLRRDESTILAYLRKRAA